MSLKRLAVISLILSFIVGLSGCSKSKHTIDDLNVPKLEQATLKLCFIGNKPAGMDEVIAEAEKRAASELNVKLDFEFFYMYPESYYNQMKAKISSGQPFDAFMLFDTDRRLLEEFVQDDVIADITDLLPQYAPEIFFQIDDAAMNYIRVKDRIYAVPRLYPIIQRLGVTVRQDLLEKYKVSSINNYDQLEAFLEKIKQNENDIYPLTTYNTSLGLFAPVYGYVILDYEIGLVYKWNDKDMVIQAWEQTPEFKEAENRLAYWYRQKYLRQGHNVNADNTIYNSGKWAVIVRNMGDSVYQNIKSEIDDSSKGFKYSEFPLYPEQAAEKVSPLLFSFVVGKQSANKERVLMFLNWVQSSRENNRLFRYGLEGRDYQVVNESIAVTNTASSLDQVFASWSGSNAFVNVNYEGPYWIGGKSFDMQKYWEEMSRNTRYLPHGGFFPDYTPVNVIQITRRMTYTNQVMKMERGVYQEKDAEEFIEEMKKANTDELVKTIQQQLDAWRKQDKK